MHERLAVKFIACENDKKNKGFLVNEKDILFSLFIFKRLDSTVVHFDLPRCQERS